ncbi:MAG: hypothetical protein H0T89_07055 [Deltaproteobacteria bacterium]|nr:hypothetical protein [Deltaproteobacteria bacterium]MDQ3301438.1 hypothetical protein [Myxococcota bacterium]
MQPFLVPDDFRAFMQRVASYLDLPSGEKLLDGEEALKDPTGYGGRIDDGSFRFMYLGTDGAHKWEIPLGEAAIRDIADGLLIEVPAVQHEVRRTKHRAPSGKPLLIWGEYVDDALAIRDEEQLLVALDALKTASPSPRMLRLWSATDDQCVAVICGENCALYVVESLEGYGTSVGDARRDDAYEIFDHEGQALHVPGADGVPWQIARKALAHFALRGDLGATVTIEGRIPSVLLMMGDVDRKAALDSRGGAPHDLEKSSMPRLSAAVPQTVDAVEEITTPHDVAPPLSIEELAAWARRLIDMLFERELIELGRASLDEITYQLGGLLQAHGTEAQDSLDTAEWLANEIGAVRGIRKLFATGGDLQIALRRSRDA